MREIVHLGRLPKLGLLGAPTAEDNGRVDRPWPTPMQRLAATAVARALWWRTPARTARAGAGRGRAFTSSDEPTSHLDPPHQVALVRLVQRQVRTGTTVVSVLHDLSLALLADRLVVMDHGRIHGEGVCDDPVLHAELIQVFGGVSE